MTRRNPILTFSLCTSLMVHGLALAAVAWWVIAHTPLPKLAALDKTQIQLQQMMQAEPTPPPAPPPAAKKKPPEPKKDYEKPHETPRDDSGEANGTGTANRSTPGLTPMQANQGYEQADLMKQADKFADDAFLPASAGNTAGNNATPQKSPQKGAFSPDLVTQSKPATDAKMAIAATPLSKAPGGLKPADPAKSAVATASGAKTPIANLPQSQIPTPKSVQKEIIGHKATASDTESLAMAKDHHLEFRAGRLDGRRGLKVKTTEPRYGDASSHDFEILGDVPTVVRATVDVDGNVLNAEVVEPSGSDNIDMDRKLAVYNWILEPDKDKDGHPIDFTWVVTLQ